MNGNLTISLGIFVGFRQFLAGAHRAGQVSKGSDYVVYFISKNQFSTF